MVMLKAVATAALAVALVGSPLAALDCNDTGPAAMACCQDKASECNQPGKTDDCCRKVPVEKDAAVGPGQVIAGKHNWTSVISNPNALVPAVAKIIPSSSSLTLRPASRTTWADLAPPPLSVLRV
jgi:hypothetical protein